MLRCARTRVWVLDVRHHACCKLQNVEGEQVACMCATYGETQVQRSALLRGVQLP